MVKKYETPEEEVITFTRYCPIIDRIITVDGGLKERELAVEKLIIEKDKEEPIQ